MTFLRNTLIALTLVLATLSCSEPASYEEFIRCDEAPGALYCFDIDFADTTALYDISFYTRIDPGFMQMVEEEASLALAVSWFAPAPASTAPAMSETVYIRYGTQAGTSELYRSDARPSPGGVWKICVKPLDPPSGLRGIGIIRKRHGTR